MADKQPDVVRVAVMLGLVDFDDGAEGKITQWIDPQGDVHEEPIAHAIAVVAQHPTNQDAPLYAVALSEFAAPEQ